jgi:hypothetical protein
MFDAGPIGGESAAGNDGGPVQNHGGVLAEPKSSGLGVSSLAVSGLLNINKLDRLQ